MLGRRHVQTPPLRERDRWCHRGRQTAVRRRFPREQRLLDLFGNIHLATEADIAEWADENQVAS